MLKLGISGVDGVGRTASSDAGQGEVVVQGEDSLWVVETFHILSWFGEVLCSEHVLKHMREAWNGLKPAMIMQ